MQFWLPKQQARSQCKKGPYFSVYELQILHELSSDVRRAMYFPWALVIN